MYWIIALLQQTSTNILSWEIMAGIIIGLVPGIITAYVARRKWFDGEREVTQTQADINQAKAIESISGAAGVIAAQSQALTEKSAMLVTLLEDEVARQKSVIEEERRFNRELKQQHGKEIAELKTEISNIYKKIELCTTELRCLIKDVKENRPITDERLLAIEQNMV